MEESIQEQLTAELSATRKALNEIANMDMTRSDRPTPYHVAICALGSLNTSHEKRQQG